MIFRLLLFVLLASVAACSTSSAPAGEASSPAGKLFIIGGGPRPTALVQALAQASGISEGGYAVVLPMSSQERDTAVHYAIQQFVDLGLPRERFVAYDFEKGDYPTQAVDSLRGAQLIYITGGDQNRFMDIVAGSPVYEAIHQAYQRGATVAGTSAGAAVMSRKMITGNEKRHPEYTGNFRTIEAGNIEIGEGLGLLEAAIVDQHFIYRMRMNRLIAAVLEHPEAVGIGIDESTALVVEGGRFAKVAGSYQVIALRNPKGIASRQDSLLGGRGLELSVLLPGDTLLLE